MLIRRSLTLLACLTFPLHAAETRDVFVSLRPAAEVPGKVVRLGDVAVMTVRNPVEQVKWQAIEVARPLSLANPIRLSREEIVRQVGAAHPEWQNRLVWGGSNEVLVSGKLQRIDLEAAVNNAAAFLMERLSDGDFVSLRLVDGADPIEVPIGNVRSRPDTRAARKIGSYVEIPLIVDVDGVQAARPMLRFAVSRSQRNATVETPAKPSVPALATEQSRAPVVDIADATPFVVSRQQPVTILIDGGGIRIESEGVALANARQGEKVRVRRTHGNVELAGRAVQQGVVLVEEN